MGRDELGVARLVEPIRGEADEDYILGVAAYVAFGVYAAIAWRLAAAIDRHRSSSG